MSGAQRNPQALGTSASTKRSNKLLRIGEVIAGLIQSNTKFQGRVLRATRIDDLALLYSDFDVTSVDGSGKTVKFFSKAIEVLRRQADGTWKLIIGDPNARG